MANSLDDGFEFFSHHEWVFGRLCNMCAGMKAMLQSLELESPEEVELNTRKFRQQMRERIEEELDQLYKYEEVVNGMVNYFRLILKKQTCSSMSIYKSFRI